MMTGTVKWFNNTKGFGFIIPDVSGDAIDDTPRDIFAHYSEITMDGYRALKAGQFVTFDIRNGDKGEQATNIKTISKVELPNYKEEGDKNCKLESSAPAACNAEESEHHHV